MGKFNLLPLIFVIGLGGCSIQSIVADRLGSALESGVVGQDDPELVREGMASYLLLLDGLIADSPDEPALLRAAAQLYGGYSGLIEDQERAGRLALKARDYGRRAACQQLADLCTVLGQPLDNMMSQLEVVSADQLDSLYLLASSWAGWIQADSDDWNAVADIPKVEAMMKHIVALDVDYEEGWPQLYLGVLNSILPPAYGGKPEVAREYFEQARSNSAGDNLMVNVLFAQFYARLVFDQELHDELLKEVLAATPEKHELRLVNTLAKAQAKLLLDESTEYF